MPHKHWWGNTRTCSTHTHTHKTSIRPLPPLTLSPPTEPNTDSFFPKMVSVKTITFLNLIQSLLPFHEHFHERAFYAEASEKLQLLYDVWAARNITGAQSSL